jgi:hypothetical protein
MADPNADDATRREVASTSAGATAEPTAPPRPKEILGRFSPAHVASAALVAAAAGIVAAYVGFAMLLKRGR